MRIYFIVYFIDVLDANNIDLVYKFGYGKVLT
jgi:hypothetical protein